MQKNSIPEISIKNALRAIFARGYIKNLRGGDTGIGYTLETELGIPENNLEDADFTFNGEPVELKTQREHATSNITLFTKEPEKGDIEDRDLILKYGYSDVKGRRGLKITLTTKGFNPQGFKLIVDKKNKKINLVHREDGIIWHYHFDELFSKLKKKFSHNLLLVIAEAEKRKEGEYLHYKKGYYLSNISQEKFIELVEKGIFVVEFRMHLKDNGTARNHGTGFRIHERHIRELFSMEETID